MTEQVQADILMIFSPEWQQIIYTIMHKNIRDVLHSYSHILHSYQSMLTLIQTECDQCKCHFIILICICSEMLRWPLYHVMNLIQARKPINRN